MDAQLLYEEIKELGKPDTIQKVGRPRYRVGETVYFTFGKEDERKATELLNGLMIMEHWDKRKKFLMILWEFNVIYWERNVV